MGITGSFKLHTTLTVNFSKDLKVQNFDNPLRQTF